MSGTFGKMIKEGGLMFAVGVLLALAAPLLATLAGGEATLGPVVFKHAVETPVLWTGVFFGGFGALHAACSPLFDNLFAEKDSPENGKAPAAGQEKSLVQNIGMVIQPQPQKSKDWVEFVSDKHKAADNTRAPS